MITPAEEQAGFPKRPVAKPGYEADLKKRTLTNLYNALPACQLYKGLRDFITSGRCIRPLPEG